MYEVRKMSIWKPEERMQGNPEEYNMVDITELNLSVRSYNCLRRAGCNTIGDVLRLIDKENGGLRKIRNLGSRSETEILENIKNYKEVFDSEEGTASTIRKQKKKILRPAKKIWDENIETFHLSNYALTRLKNCGINQVKDLYATNPKKEPGWYAVRELFEKIPYARCETELR